VLLRIAPAPAGCRARSRLHVCVLSLRACEPACLLRAACCVPLRVSRFQDGRLGLNQQHVARPRSTRAAEREALLSVLPGLVARWPSALPPLPAVRCLSWSMRCAELLDACPIRT